MRRAEVAQRDVRFILQPLVKRHRNVRLTIPGSPVRTTTRPSSWMASRHRRSSRSISSSRPNSGCSLLACIASKRLSTPLIPNTCEADILRKPFQGKLTEFAIIEIPSTELARARANQHRPWLRQCLQTRREVRRFTDDGLFRRDLVDEQLAHNHGAGRNANSSLQSSADIRPKTRYRIDDF